MDLRYPHNPNFTQGLFLVGDKYYESSGLYGKSKLQEISLLTGEILRSINLPSQYFAEGIAVIDDWIIQLTWREETAFAYQVKDFHLGPKYKIEWPGEGWGLCYGGGMVFSSDGSHRLKVRSKDPPFNVERILEIVDEKGKRVEGLNALCWAKGKILANLFNEWKIAIINLEEGRVERWIGLSSLSKEKKDREMVLNGLMWDETRNEILATGKKWDWIYRIKY